jgi:hypothetical protein
MKAARLLFIALLLILPALVAPITGAAKTVCTITVNSSDEKNAFRRHLRHEDFQFVELVDRNRPDWLANACEAGVRCDVLIVSGHHDGEDFFSDRIDLQQHLPVAELERVSCSETCPSLFADLKEVYLFGCNTLNPEPLGGAAAEIVRALVREGRTDPRALRLLRSMNSGHGESSRDLMRQIFKDTPAIYGFSSAAPLGPIAAAALEQHLRSAGTNEFGTGFVSHRLLERLNAYNMSVTSGLAVTHPAGSPRRDICGFADERLSDAQRLRFVHELLGGPAAEAGMHLDRIRKLTRSLDATARQYPDVVAELALIQQDSDSRQRFLAFAKRIEASTVRVRMLNVAGDVGWLSAEARRDELARMMNELLARNRIGVEEVNMACTINQSHELDGLFDRRITMPHGPNDLGQAAVRAWLGSGEARRPNTEGLLSDRESDVEVAQTYLRHRAFTDVDELRRVTLGIAAMRGADAQVRALESLAAHNVEDRIVLATLIRLFTETTSAAVQSAIAGILIRVDRNSIAGPQLAEILENYRRQSPAGDNLIDVLIRSLQSP